VLLSGDYMMHICTTICWYCSTIVGVIWNCIRGPVFWDTVVIFRAVSYVCFLGLCHTSAF